MKRVDPPARYYLLQYIRTVICQKKREEKTSEGNALKFCPPFLIFFSRRAKLKKKGGKDSGGWKLFRILLYCPRRRRRRENVLRKKLCKNSRFFLVSSSSSKGGKCRTFLFILHLWEIESPMILWAFRKWRGQFRIFPCMAAMSSVGIEWPMTAQEEKKRFIIITFPNVAIWRRWGFFLQNWNISIANFQARHQAGAPFFCSEMHPQIERSDCCCCCVTP